tara:strand:+ start:118 stop:483 length:366 start_codon:yes stop_codon:yes gene_type:complete
MGLKDFAPQAKRLEEFVNETGYSINAFTKECDIPSRSTMTKILEEGRTPSSKVLDKIIRRFPMLSRDYITLGIGDMMLESLPKEEAGQPFTSMDGEMLWNRVDALEQRLSNIEKILSNLVR